MIADLPKLVWKRMATAVGGECTWEDLRSSCQHTAAVSCGYASRDVFDVLKQSPFWITQGDPAENLEKLRATPMDQVHDETLGKVKELQDEGVEDEEIGELVELMKDAPCTVTVMEQVHMSNEINAKGHPYGEQTLLTRGRLHATRSLFLLDKMQRLEKRLREHQERLARKCPDRVTGRHMFLAERAGKIDRTWNGDPTDLFQAMITNMEEHAEAYDALPLSRKLALDDLARCDMDASLDPQ